MGRGEGERKWQKTAALPSSELCKERFRGVRESGALRQLGTLQFGWRIGFPRESDEK